MKKLTIFDIFLSIIFLFSCVSFILLLTEYIQHWEQFFLNANGGHFNDPYLGKKHYELLVSYLTKYTIMEVFHIVTALFSIISLINFNRKNWATFKSNFIESYNTHKSENKQRKQKKEENAKQRKISKLQSKLNKLDQ